MAIAGHAAVLIVEKSELSHMTAAAEVDSLEKEDANRPACFRFEELRSDSMIAMTPDGGVELDVNVSGLRLQAKAEPAFCAPFVQTTAQPGTKGRFNGGKSALNPRGCHQGWRTH